MQYLFTERAHLMCPHMNFGIVMSVGVPYEEKRVRKAMEQLSAAHPFLNALLAKMMIEDRTKKVIMACRGDYPSKPGKFAGSMFFGYDAPRGYSITNLGRINHKCMTASYFIPPASPAVRKTQGVLTVNGQMTVCTRERTKGI